MKDIVSVMAFAVVFVFGFLEFYCWFTGNELQATMTLLTCASLAFLWGWRMAGKREGK